MFHNPNHHNQMQIINLQHLYVLNNIISYTVHHLFYTDLLQYVHQLQCTHPVFPLPPPSFIFQIFCYIATTLGIQLLTTQYVTTGLCHTSRNWNQSTANYFTETVYRIIPPHASKYPKCAQTTHFFQCQSLQCNFLLNHFVTRQ